MESHIKWTFSVLSLTSRSLTGLRFARIDKNICMSETGVILAGDNLVEQILCEAFFRTQF